MLNCFSFWEAGSYRRWAQHLKPPWSNTLVFLLLLLERLRGCEAARSFYRSRHGSKTAASRVKDCRYVTVSFHSSPSFFLIAVLLANETAASDLERPQRPRNRPVVVESNFLTRTRGNLGTRLAKDEHISGDVAVFRFREALPNVLSPLRGEIGQPDTILRL